MNSDKSLVTIHEIQEQFVLNEKRFVLLGVVAFEEPVNLHYNLRHYVAYSRKFSGQWIKHDNARKSSKIIKDQELNVALLFYFEYESDQSNNSNNLLGTKMGTDYNQIFESKKPTSHLTKNLKQNSVDSSLLLELINNCDVLVGEKITCKGTITDNISIEIVMKNGLDSPDYNFKSNTQSFSNDTLNNFNSSILNEKKTCQTNTSSNEQQNNYNNSNNKFEIDNVISEDEEIVDEKIIFNDSISLPNSSLNSSQDISFTKKVYVEDSSDDDYSIIPKYTAEQRNLIVY